MFSLLSFFLTLSALFFSSNISLYLWWIPPPPPYRATHSFASADVLSEGLLLSYHREILSHAIKSKCLVVFSKDGTGISVDWLCQVAIIQKLGLLHEYYKVICLLFYHWICFVISMMAFYSSFLTSIDGLFFLHCK